MVVYRIYKFLIGLMPIMLAQLLAKPKHKIAVIVIIIALLVIFYYWHKLIYFPATDNAYVQANVVNIASEVGGRVTNIYVQNHDQVKRNALFFTIDARPYQYTVDRAQAQLQLAHQQMGAASDAVRVAKAVVARYEAQLIVTQKNTDRTLTLVQHGQLPKANADDAQAKLNVAKASLAQAKSQLQQAMQNLGKEGEQNAQVQTAQAALNQAQLNLLHTKVFSPANGAIANFTLRVGDMISVGTPLFALVEQETWWVDANYKETDIKRIQIGQPATVEMDIYPGHIFKGKVVGISAGSGASFSLLPPENATGNWVKVTQRFPVKVQLLDPDSRYPFRIGASCNVTIDTRNDKS